MYYKSDWDASQKRYAALWNRELTDRCCVSVTSPRRGKESEFHSERYHRARYAILQHMWEPDKVLEESRFLLENTFYGGEALPQIWFNYGPAGQAAYFNPDFNNDGFTTWYEPIIHDWETDRLKFSPDSPMVKAQLEMAAYLSEKGQGDFLLSTPDNAGNIDALATLRGSQELLVDMLCEPEAVQSGMREVLTSWQYMNDRLFELCRRCNQGGSSIGWLSAWAPGKLSQLQSDLSVMISNQVFRQQIMPELLCSVRQQEYSLYHFDGVEQLRHLDDLLSIPEIGMIQWVSVAGQPSYLSYFDSLKKIQQAGKGLLITDVKPKDVETVMETLSQKGLMMMVEADSQDEAEAVIKLVGKLTKDK